MLDHKSCDNVMRDVCDGSYVKDHQLFHKYPTALQFILYYDDIEVCNPLGSSAGIHKLGKWFCEYLQLCCHVRYYCSYLRCILLYTWEH